MELNQYISAIKKVKEKRPLVHHLTNLVVTNFTANGTIAYGASPIMANAIEEVEEMIVHADGLVINMGTITSSMVEAMKRAGKEANQRKKPIIFDPVGIGATKYRAMVGKTLLTEFRPTVIRGNAAEMAHLAGVEWKIKGVDSIGEGGNRIEIAKKIAQIYKVVAVVTGVTDVITDGEKVILIDNGVPMLSHVTGTGCLATALIGATLAAEQDPFVASIASLIYYEIAAEIAAKKSEGPGSFAVHILDELYRMKIEEVISHAKIRGA